MDSTPLCIWNCNAILGESPLWCERRSILFFLDIFSKKLLAWSESTQNVYSLPRECSALAHTASGDFLFCAADSIEICGLPPAEPISNIILKELSPKSRLNDGKCDQKGRFFVASMDLKEKTPVGKLWSIDSNMAPTVLESDIVVGNGIGWSPNSSIMYFTDSAAGLIYQFDYSIDSGEISNKQVFASVPEGKGLPDGLCVDSAGDIWSAHWDGWGITRYLPDGTVAEFIELPVPRVTSLAFGGPKLNKLFITTASFNLRPDQIKAAPLSGGLFVFDAPNVGLPVGKFIYNSGDSVVSV